jgi:hypothetical protein
MDKLSIIVYTANKFLNETVSDKTFSSSVNCILAKQQFDKQYATVEDHTLPGASYSS